MRTSSTRKQTGNEHESNELSELEKNKHPPQKHIYSDESRIDYSNRQVERNAAEGWVLFPNVQRAADSAKKPYQMERHAGTEGGEGEVYRDVGEEV